jgi:hypothetical protein
MKKISFNFKTSLRLIFLSVFVLGGVLTTQTVKAIAGPCALTSVHAGPITADETWCGGGDNKHYLTDDVTVQAGVTLTIAPGVTVDSAEAAWSKYMIVRGHLDINGTLAQPVLLTRSYNYPNQNWSGLYFDGSQGDGSGTINYAIIEHAGSNFLPPDCVGTCGNAQTAIFVKGLSADKQVTISNSTIYNNVAKGLYIVDSKVNVTDTIFSNNHYPIWIDGAGSVVSYSGNSFVDNTFGYPNINYPMPLDAIVIGPGALMGHDFSLQAQPGLDAYIFSSDTTIPFGRIMTLGPGVTLRMPVGKYLTVQGYLRANGTQALPVTFDGIPHHDDLTNIDYWGGLYFDGSAGGGSGDLTYANIERGGDNLAPPTCTGACSAQNAVFVKDLPVGKQVNIRNSVIEDSLSKGLYVVNSPTFSGNNNLIKGGRIGAYLATNMTISNLAVIDQALDGVIVETGYSVEARHLTIARAGQNGFHVLTGGIGMLRNSILSHNARAVWVEGSGQATLGTNLADANPTFNGGTGTVTALNTINGVAEFKSDGYHIQNTSSAVGNGQIGLSVVDIDGEARPAPAGTLPDLGADEVPVGFWKVFLPLLIR